MEEEESKAILNMLFAKTLRHEYHYRHHWQPNMLVFWDNQSVQQSALHDYYPQRWLMERVTINNGERPIGDAPPVDPSTLRKYLMSPMMDFSDTRQKRQHES
jgi:taurine dioxygenase